MDDIFKKVFERISKMSDAELRKRLDGAADHPLVRVHEAISCSSEFLPTLILDEEFSKHDIEINIPFQSISYEKILLTDDFLAKNDERFIFAA